MKNGRDFAAQTYRSHGKPWQSIGVLDSVPADFDASTHRIIGLHFFGIEPIHPSSDTVNMAARLKRERQVARLHSLGPRPVLEALIEVDAGAELDTVLTDYAQLDPEVVIALGGDKFPPVPIHGVEQ